MLGLCYVIDTGYDLRMTKHMGIRGGKDVQIVNGAPDLVFKLEVQFPIHFLPKILLNYEATQVDALTVDNLASLEKYTETSVVPNTPIMTIEMEGLKSNKLDFVILGVVSVACGAVVDAGILSRYVSNIKGDFIHAEYVVAAKNHHWLTMWQILQDNSHCEFLIRLPEYCPTPAL
ncbi:hypothetical protein RND71_040366 [Anisodus tanguticus]|uniref:Uncharacterized protein n=1 Tax=Anisodus tanguticus TaxID=243964 RepID=A0AAE1UVN7_9SOLA|nr:hypothetical protein RND71_040366 [Anisodus tanguticus]